MKMVINEFKNLLKNKILMISVIAITFIPIIYTSVFDKSLWNPYGGIKDFPVAVVNEDENVELMGQKVNVGEKIIENIKTNKDIDWHIVDAKEAAKGMKDMKYYTIVTIPKDFSKSAASIMDDEPKKMELIYTTNGSYNYIGKEISEVAANELEIKIRDQVVEAYVSAVKQEADKMIGSLGEAAAGANELSTGTGQLETGIAQYTNGVSQADTGADKLAAGTEQLESAVGPLASGVDKLTSGSEKLSSALNQVEAGIQANQTRITALDGGVSSLSKAAQDMANALENFENHLSGETRSHLSEQIDYAQKQLADLVTNTAALNQASVDANDIEQQNAAISSKLQAVTGELGSTNQTITSQISAIIQENQELSDEAKSNLISNVSGIVDQNLANLDQSITTHITEVNGNLAVLSTLTAQLAQQASEMSQVTGSMAQNTGNIQDTLSAIQTGSQELDEAIGGVPKSEDARTIIAQLQELSGVLNTAAADIPTLETAVQQLASGSSQLTNGLGELNSKIPSLSSGVAQLNGGSDQLEAGLNELNSKSPELVAGIEKLQAGAEELASGLDEGVEKADSIKITHKTINQFVDPTSLKNDRYTKVNNYGEALAPYIMSLALFVGCMLFNFVYPVRKSSMDGQSSGAWWLSKVSLGFVVSSLMAIIQVTIMLLLGLPAYSVLALYVTALITAWAYMSIVMFLAITFDNPGRFVAMILLVLQLGGAAGTFPIETQGKFFQIIHPYLPMTYSLYAFRNAIASGISQQLLVKCFVILVSLIIVFLFLLRVSMAILQKNHLRDVSLLNDNQKMLALEIDDKERLAKQIKTTEEKDVLNKEEMQHEK
jgi:putative membrane protein